MAKNTHSIDRHCSDSELSASSRLRHRGRPGPKPREGSPREGSTTRREAKQNPFDRNITLKIEQCLMYMVRHLDRRVSVRALSAQAGISPSYFHSIFLHLTGYSPGDFLIRARMRRAAELLQETNLKIREIAALLGYCDQFYFCRQFKAVTQFTPSEYRDTLARGVARRSLALAFDPFKKEYANGFLSRYLSVSRKNAPGKSNGVMMREKRNDPASRGFSGLSVNLTGSTVCPAP
jgi:AraC-like DNA-binding protein